jgi:3-oxoacyl-[acyl-carrier protein] reductase
MAETTANSVMVSLTETEAVMNCGSEMADASKAEFFPTHSIDKFGPPEDVADVIDLLCSHDARWITGSAVSASGGGFKIL